MAQDGDPQGHVLAVYVGQPQTFTTHQGTTWTSAIVKSLASGSVAVRFDGLDGDQQADLKVHGGCDKAVCFYPAAHLKRWSDRLHRSIEPGAFGENISVAGWTERITCIGDRLRLGSALLEVSQPRSPCYKIARRWGVDDMVRAVQQTGATGWYCRVIEEGTVAAGADVELVDRPHPDVTIERLNAARWRHADPTLAERLAAVAQLTDKYRAHFPSPKR